MDNPPGVRCAVVEREFAVPPDRLWRALTLPHLMEEWLMKNDFSPEVGHSFTLRGEWGGIIDCQVRTVEPGRSLSYTWNHKHDDPAYDLRSVVTFTLTPIATGTLLRVEQVGFRPDHKQAFGGAIAGWRNFLGRLDQLVVRDE